MPNVLVPLASGFEEIEAVTIIDVLRRADVQVTVAGLGPGTIRGAHGVDITPDATIADVESKPFDMVVLPGGMPGAKHLRDDPVVQRIVRRVGRAGGITAAICAAPIALSPTGVTKNRSVTCYPGFADQVDSKAHLEDRVVVDGPVITSRAPGTALEFALTLVEKIAGRERAQAISEAMLVTRSTPAREIGA